jgi:hypothetical protein
MSSPVLNAKEESITLRELLKRSAESAINIQCEDGAFPQRKTTYYGDPQQPVRITSQWLRIFTEVYSITNDRKFLKAARDASSYLVSDKVRPHGYTFHCRNSSNKDKVNGVFGQAIPIWALATAADSFNKERLHKVAEEVAVHHPYDEYLSLWHRVEIDGKVLPIDRTLNHQLAFAAAVSTVKNDKCQSNVLNFLDNLENLIGIRSTRVIRHLSKTPLIHQGDTTYKNKLTTLRNRVLFELYSYSQSTKYKEISYHPLNIFWLSCLKKQFPNHSIWDSDLINNIINIIKTDYFKNQVQKPDMSFTVSATGFYVGVALAIFEENISDAISWIEKQLSYAYDLSNELLVKDVADRVKMASNLCYLTEFPDLDVKLRFRN